MIDTQMIENPALIASIIKLIISYNQRWDIKGSRFPN